MKTRSVHTNVDCMGQIKRVTICDAASTLSKWETCQSSRHVTRISHLCKASPVGDKHIHLVLLLDTISPYVTDHSWPGKAIAKIMARISKFGLIKNSQKGQVFVVISTSFAITWQPYVSSVRSYIAISRVWNQELYNNLSFSNTVQTRSVNVTGT